MYEELATAIPSITVKLFALMTPPAVLSAFLGNTQDLVRLEKNKIALKTSLAIFIIGIALYLWGAKLFELFGFTLDAFRIGAGVLLFLNGVALVINGESESPPLKGDISVVPLAVPLGMGPASIGAIMVLGAAEDKLEQLAGAIALFLASVFMFLLLLFATAIAKVLRNTGIAVLARLTGLLMAAIAAQVVFTGIAGFLF